jgi:hypothetical protein
MERFCIVVAVPGESGHLDPPVMRHLVRAGWEPVDIPLTRGPEPAVVVSRPCADLDEAHKEAWVVDRLLGDLQPGEDLVGQARRELLEPPYAINILDSGSIVGSFDDLIKTTQPKNAPPEPPDSETSGAETGAKQAPKKAASDGESPQAPGAPATDAKGKAETDTSAGEHSQLYATGLSALEASKLWDYVKEPERAALAEEQLKALYGKRASYPDLLPWVLAPESQLFAAVENTKRPQFAAEMLAAREGLAAHQIALESARTEMVAQQAALLQVQVATATAEVRLVDSQVALAGTAVQAAQELVEQLRRWRALSRWGTGFLVVGTAIALVVLIELVDFVDDGKMDGWELAVGIFALALFVISPAVLLLRERPLQGLDQWMPGGKAAPPAPAAESDGEATTEKKSDAKEKKGS